MRKLKKIVRNSDVGYVTGIFRSNYSSTELQRISKEIFARNLVSYEKKLKVVLKLDNRFIISLKVPLTEKTLRDNKKTYLIPQDANENIIIMYHETAIEVILLFDKRVPESIGVCMVYQNGWNIMKARKFNF